MFTTYETSDESVFFVYLSLGSLFRSVVKTNVKHLSIISGAHKRDAFPKHSDKLTIDGK